MGSGPMRAAAGKEDLFDTIGNREQADVAVGILETRQAPARRRLPGHCPRNARVEPAEPDAAGRAHRQPGRHRCRSWRGASRRRCTSCSSWGSICRGSSAAAGIAPLPPASADDLAAIGRTNDAILYGGEVTLWVRGDDASLEAIGPRVPSGASADYGQPFAAIFERYDRDFYRIDPHLFSPAVVTLCKSGHGPHVSLRPHAAAGDSRIV